jgi:hypothetical protein
VLGAADRPEVAHSYSVRASRPSLWLRHTLLDGSALRNRRLASRVATPGETAPRVPALARAASRDGLRRFSPGRHEQGHQLPQVVDLVMRHRLVVRPGVGAAQPYGAQANTPRPQNVILWMIADKPGVVRTETQAIEGMLKDRGMGFLHPHRL